MIRTTMAVVLGALLLTACGNDDKAIASAANLALDKNFAGGTLGDCLNIAGYDVDPSYVRDGTIMAPGDGWWRVSFQNEQDTGQFIHIGANVDTGQVVAYKQEDEQSLTAAGCALSGPVLL